MRRLRMLWFANNETPWANISQCIKHATLHLEALDGFARSPVVGASCSMLPSPFNPFPFL